MAIEEEERAEGLVLGGSRDMLLCGEVREKSLDFRGAHFGGVALAVKEDEAAHPLDIGLLGAVGIVPSAKGLTHLVEEFGFAGRGHRFPLSHFVRLRALVRLDGKAVDFLRKVGILKTKWVYSV